MDRLTARLLAVLLLLGGTAVPASAALLQPFCAALEEKAAASAKTPRARDDAGWRASVEQLKAQAPSAQAPLLLVGDSLFARWGRATRAITLGTEAFNIGVGGDMTANVLWRMANGHLPAAAPKTIAILIGTNNTNDAETKESGADIAGGVVAVMHRLIDAYPHAHIVLIGILPRYGADDPGRADLATANMLLEHCAAAEQVTYVDLWDEFLGPDGAVPLRLMHDGLHPSFLGYRIIGAALKQAMAANQ